MCVRPKLLLHIAVCVILFNLICNMTVFRKKNYFYLLTQLRSEGCVQGAKCLLYVVVYFIHFNLICNMTIFLKKYFNWVRGQGQGPRTHKRYATLIHLKMHPHTKFEISTSNNIEDMLWTPFFEKQGHRSRSE